jgi:hypothetical protein
LQTASDGVDKYLAVTNVTIALRNELLAVLQSTFQNSTFYNPTGFDTHKNATIESLVGLHDFIQEPAHTLRRILATWFSLLSEARNYLSRFDLRYTLLAVGLVLIMLPTILICVMIHKTSMIHNSNNHNSNNNQRNWVITLTRWLIVPMFILDNIFLYLVMSIVLSVAIMNADFCLGGSVGPGAEPSPSGSILHILDEAGMPYYSLQYTFIEFVVLVSAELTPLRDATIIIPICALSNLGR